jgi:hypothetical protein
LQITKKCPECNAIFKGNICNCGWKPDYDQAKFFGCSVCGERAMRSKFKDKDYCEKHWYEQYENDWKPTATKDQISKFLVRMGSKSIYWKNATEEQRLDAIEYYKKYGRVKNDPQRL